MIRDGLLKCKVLKGMFSDERAIVYRLRNGGTSNDFVPSEKVHGEIDADGSVEVQVFEDGGVTWAVLPTDYRETIPVQTDDLILQ